MITIFTSNLSTPLGDMVVGTTSQKLCLLEFKKNNSIEYYFKNFTFFLDFELKEKESEISLQTKKQLHEYFNLQRHIFDIPLLLIGTEFQIKIWKTLNTIPFGKTMSYKEQAIKYGELKAIRAMASANGKNPISIIIPCHRVIGSNGSLTGYGGGIWRKKKLLQLESNQELLFKK